MPTYKITDPQSGQTLRLTGESPPSESELAEIFSHIRRPFPGKPKEERQEQPPAKRPSGQSPSPREQSSLTLAEQASDTASQGDTPDVLLDVPSLKVEEIKLNVENLEARVALSAQLSELVRIDVGAQVGIAKVDLDIRGVEAQALLKVRLKQVYQILARALQTLETHPEILRNALTPVGQAIDGIGKDAGRAVGELGAQTDGSQRPEPFPLSKAIGQSGNTTERVAKGVTAQKGPISEALGDVSSGVDKSINGVFQDTEEERRHFSREDKEFQPATAEYEDEDLD